MKIFLSAGEASGDAHGARLVAELKKLLPSATFFGLGGEKMAAAGVKVQLDISWYGTIGIWEALPNFFPLWRAFNQAKKIIQTENPDLVILIDSQGFNLPLARFCRQRKIKTVYYIAPQQWLWGSPKGVTAVAKLLGLIVAIFPQEYAAYKQAGANVVYFGHPLIDQVNAPVPRRAGQIALCPGSRRQELRSLLPILLAAAALIKKTVPVASFVLPAATERVAAELRAARQFLKTPLGSLTIVTGQTQQILASSDLAICASGTINLEASLLGVPNLMVYKLSWLTYLIGKYLLRIDKKIKYFSMPNILLNQSVLPELIMNEATPERIAAAALPLLQNPLAREKMLQELARLSPLLGQGPVINRIAEAIVNYGITP